MPTLYVGFVLCALVLYVMFVNDFDKHIGEIRQQQLEQSAVLQVRRGRGGCECGQLWGGKRWSDPFTLCFVTAPSSALSAPISTSAFASSRACCFAAKHAAEAS